MFGVGFVAFGYGKRLEWNSRKAWRVRVISAFRCLIYPHFVLVAWEKCDDNQMDYRIIHKGVNAGDAAHYLRHDACELLEEIAQENAAVDLCNNIFSK